MISLIFNNCVNKTLELSVSNRVLSDLLKILNHDSKIKNQVFKEMKTIHFVLERDLELSLE